jgi:hypothetical protein
MSGSVMLHDSSKIRGVQKRMRELEAPAARPSEYVGNLVFSKPPAGWVRDKDLGCDRRRAHFLHPLCY